MRTKKTLNLSMQDIAQAEYKQTGYSGSYGYTKYIRIEYLGELLSECEVVQRPIIDIIGNCNWRVYDNVGGGQVIYLYNLCTASPFRNRGIATKLIKYVISTVQLPIVLMVDTSNRLAIDLYAKLGFVVIADRAGLVAMRYEKVEN